MRGTTNGVLPLAVFAIVFAMWAPSAAADAPFLVDADRIDSRNHAFFAVPGPDQKSTRVFRRTKAGPAVQEWSMPTWSVMGYLSNDGNYLVSVYPGVNILAVDYKPDDVMLAIRNRGKPVRDVHLNELIRDFRSLGPRSESGFPWGEYEGFIGLHRFVVSTVEHRRIVFDVETGRETETTPPPGSESTRKRRAKR